MNIKIFSKFKERIQEKRRRHFMSFFNLPTDGSILDISCGDGNELGVIHMYNPNLKFYGMDMSKNVINQAQAKYPWGNFTIARAESLPYKKDEFDVVLSCMSLHHYDKAQEVFKEVTRVLSSKGTFYIIDMVPRNIIHQWLCNINGCGEPYHFEKYYTKSCIEKFSNKTGLQIVSIKNMKKLQPMRIIRLRKIFSKDAN